MTLSLLFQSTYILRRPRVANLANIIKIATMFIKQPLKTQKKLKKWEIMYQNAIYNCFFFVLEKMVIYSEEMMISAEFKRLVT